jgi:hypothetical protein
MITGLELWNRRRTAAHGQNTHDAAQQRGRVPWQAHDTMHRLTAEAALGYDAKL